MGVGMKLSMRKYQSEDDFWRIRNFLRDVFIQNDRRMLCWPVARWDYWRWHGIMNIGDGTLETGVYLWETPNGEIAAVLNREGAGQAFLQVHPAFKSAALEEQMISQAEEYLKTTSRRGDLVLWVWLVSGDSLRQEILERRGYTHREDADEHQWRRDLEEAIPESPAREGYLIRSLGDVSELPLRSWASWRAFHPDEPDENYEGWDWFVNIQSAPLYRRDLDIIAATPDGQIASFCTIYYDDATRSAVTPLVGTAASHQRRGLCKAVLCEGMRRLQKMGCTRIFSKATDPAAEALYGSVMNVKYTSETWIKDYKR